MTRLSRIILIIVGIPTAYFIYSLFSIEKSEFTYFLIPLGIIIAITIVFQSQIDSWWIKRTKPQIDPVLLRILQSKITGYDDLFIDSFYQPEDHAIYTYDCEFIGQGLENVPDDLQHIITAHAFFFGNQEHKKWPRHFDRVVLYKHPFLTPSIDSVAHTVEHHFDDGVIIFSLEQLMAAIERRGRFYNIALHGFADAFLELYPLQRHLTNDEIWNRLSTLGVKKSEIVAIIGLEEINTLAVVAHFYVYQPDKIYSLFPELRNSLFAVMNVKKTVDQHTE